MIDKNIPIPMPKVGRPPKHPWRGMQVGDSFQVTRYQNLAQNSRLTGFKFKSRTVIEDGKQLIRIWRVE